MVGEPRVVVGSATALDPDVLQDSTLYAEELDTRFQKLGAGDDVLWRLVSVRELDDVVLGGPSAAYGWGTCSCSAGGASAGTDGGGPEGGSGRCGSEVTILDQRLDVDELRERDSGVAGTSSIPFPALAGGDSGNRGSTADTTGETGCKLTTDEELRDGSASGSGGAVNSPEGIRLGSSAPGGTTPMPGIGGSGGGGSKLSAGRIPKLPATLRLPLGCLYSPSRPSCFIGIGIGAVGVHLSLRGGGRRDSGTVPVID